MITEYAVRCCCQPQKIFGYLQAPAGRRSGDIWRIVEYEPLGSPYTIANAPVSVKAHEVKFKTIVDQGVHEIAVYSDDRPIEFWRTLRGFREVRQ